MSKTTELTPSAAAYRKWYLAHKTEFNRQRAVKYAEDAAARKKAQDRQKVYRDSKPRNPTPGQQFRVIKMKHVEVFRIGPVAEMIGRDEQTIRSWERKGLIPKPIIKSVHRYYTPHQIVLLREFGDLSLLVRWDSKIRAEAIATKSKQIKAQWAGV